MSRRDEHLDDVLCHCAGDDDGHSLSAPECTATVKAGTYTPFSGSAWSSRRNEERAGAHAAAAAWTELARVASDPRRKAQYRRSAAISRLARDVHARYAGP